MKMPRRDTLVRIECAMPDRLIRRAVTEGICIRRAVRIDCRTMHIVCRDADARRLMELCESYHVNARTVGTNGREPLLRHIRRRWTLLLGAALCAALMIAFLGRIWDIRIRVDGGAPTDADRHRILAQCTALEIGVGTPLRRADTDLLRKQIAAALPDLKYADAHLEGIRLCIEANTETPAPRTFDLSEARDIVAARDGIVLSVEADSGHACVQAGDTVRTGQTLILGEESVSKEETAPVAASGRVPARCWLEGEASGRTDAEVCRRTGRASARTFLQLMNISIPLCGREEYAQAETIREIVPIGGLFLPLARVTETRYETENATETIDADALRERLAALARSSARSRIAEAGISDAEIADYWESTEIHGADMHVRAVYEIITDIAATRDDLNREVHGLGRQ